MTGANDALGAVQLVSSAADGTPANGDSTFAAFSADGTKVLFTSEANNLVPGAGAGIYVKDLITGAIRYIGGGSAYSFTPDGNSVVFSQFNSDHNVSAINEMNLTSGAVTALSTNAAGAQANGFSGSAHLSPDGRRLLFSSTGDNLVANDTNASLDWFIKDLATGAVARVSTTSAGAQLDDVGGAVIDWAANKLYFVSSAASLGVTGSSAQLFVKDLATGAVTRLLSGMDGSEANFAIQDDTLALSADGKQIAFWSSASNLVPGDDNNAPDLFVLNLATGTVTRATTAADGSQTVSGSYASGYPPSFSADGTQIAFMSQSSALVPGDSNGGYDIFVKNLVTGVVTRVSTATDGSQTTYPGAADSNVAYLGGFSPNGAEIAFVSDQMGLTGAPVSPYRDELYVKTLHAAPTAAADSYTASYSAPLKIDAAHGLLANDVVTDAKGVYQIVAFSDAKHGRVDLNPDGSFTYTPDGTFVGVDTFTYSASAGYGASAQTTVTLNVKGNIERASVASDGSQMNEIWGPDTPQFSPDGDSIILTSASSWEELFIKNLKTGALTLVAKGEGGNSYEGVFSPDGTKIAYHFDGDSSGGSIYLKDLATGATTLVSASVSGAPGDNISMQPVFSPDGTKLMFASLANNLVDGDANHGRDIFIKDLVSGAVTLVSTAADGSQGVNHVIPYDNASYTASFSSDGEKIVFVSQADNLVAGDTNQRADIFVKDLTTGKVTLVSSATSGAIADGNSDTPVFSPDGKLVAFSSSADNLVAGDTNQTADIFVKNLETGVITRVSVSASGEQSDGSRSVGSQYPAFSPDGTRIAFASYASNLIDGKTIGTEQIYEKNLKTGAIRLVSSDSFENAGDGYASMRPSYSADGTKIAFVTTDGNLVAGDTNQSWDVYIKDLTKFPYNPQDGVAQDGYLSGATVFADANGNGALDAGETSATTDARGHYSLPNASPLVATGGVDTGTGLAFAGKFEAPAGATVISPLTTLLLEVARQNGDDSASGISTANMQVTSALQISGNLSAFDVEAALLSGDANAPDAFASSAALESLARLVAGAGGDGQNVYASLAAIIRNGEFADLTDETTVGDLAMRVALGAGVTSDAANAIGAIVAATVAALNAELATAPTGRDALALIEGAALALQQDGAGALATAATFGGDFHSAADSYVSGLAQTLKTDNAVTARLAQDVSCFTAGTRIRTPRGEVVVETLRIGDLLVTREGALKPVSWIGRTTIAARFADPIRFYPVRIRAGALGEGVPNRDLLLSPDHAVLIDDVLVQAGALVNGVSILRETHAPETFVYYHVELADHALILAEGAPAETFVDNADRMNFDNWAERALFYPKGHPMQEMPYPRAKSARQVPTKIRAAIARYAEKLTLALGSVA